VNILYVSRFSLICEAPMRGPAVTMQRQKGLRCFWF